MTKKDNLSSTPKSIKVINIKKFISVIVAVKNEERYIEGCLKSLLNQDFPQEQFQIVVVDGLSTDSTHQIVKDLALKNPSRIKYYVNRKEWQSSGRNLAIINEYESDLIAYIDGHCIADKKWLRNLYESLEEIDGSDVAGIGSVHFSPKDESLIGKAIEQVFFSLLGGIASSYRNKKKITYVKTCSYVLYKRDVLVKVGMYDESMKFAEDFTLNNKIIHNGHKLFVEPNAIVYYYKRSNIRAFFKQMWNYGVAKAIAFKKYPYSINVTSIIPSISILILIALLTTAYHFPLIKLLLLLISSLYLILIGFFSFFIAMNSKKLSLIVIIPLIFLLEHFGYGIGFLNGLFKKGW